MDSGYSDQDRETNSSGGSSASNTNAPPSTVSLMSPRQTTAGAKPAPAASVAGGCTNQVVLEEVISDDYQPTTEEQLEYAATIGIDPDTEPELMYLTLEGLRAPLPPNWRPVQVTKDDLVYYFNFQTGESSWEHPCDEQFRQRVAQERARLRRIRRLRAGVRFQGSFPGADGSTIRAEKPAKAAEAQTQVEAEEARQRAEMRTRLELEEARQRAEIRAQLEGEEMQQRAEMRARLDGEETRQRAEMRARLEAERQAALKQVEAEATEMREEQKRMLDLEAAEKRVEAVAQLTELRAEVDQLRQARAGLQVQNHHQRLHETSQSQSEEPPTVLAKSRGQRLCIQRGVSLDEGAAGKVAIGAHSREDCSAGGSRGALCTDAIGRARDFLNRHLSAADTGLRSHAGSADAAATAANISTGVASRKRPQMRALRANSSGGGCGGSSGGGHRGETFPVDSSLDAGIQAAAAADAAIVAADVQQEAGGATAATALAAELRKLRCGSLPSLAAGVDSEDTSEASEQPRPKHCQLSAGADTGQRLGYGQPPPQQPLAANHRGQHRSRATPNPRRQRIDWRKVGEKPDCPQEQQPQQQSTEHKIAQHRAWLFNFARQNGLPPSGVKPLTPLG